MAQKSIFTKSECFSTNKARVIFGVRAVPVGRAPNPDNLMILLKEREELLLAGPNQGWKMSTWVDARPGEWKRREAGPGG